jgi:hypothetical protein
MKLFSLFAIAFGLVYAVVVRLATFACACFVLTLATVGLYDLLIHPFVRRRHDMRRAA